MILKFMIGNGKYAYRKCNVLKCDVDNVVCLKEKIIANKKWINHDVPKWAAYDVASGLLITKAKTKKALTEKVNGLKEKIEDIRSKSYYQDQIKTKEDSEAINTIEDVEEELKLATINKEKNKKTE